jgi:hypothetical protein
MREIFEGKTGGFLLAIQVKAQVGRPVATTLYDGSIASFHFAPLPERLTITNE